MKAKLINILLSLSLVCFILSFSAVFTLNFKPLYFNDIKGLSIEESSGYSREIIVENYNALIDYNSIFNFEPLEFNGLAMSQEGRIHFEEVRQIFVYIQTLLIVSALVLAAAFYFRRKSRDFQFLKLGVLLSIAIPLVLGALIAANWQWFFVAFHRLAFRNDYWIFDPVKDPIITILPDAFFMHCAIMILALTLLLCAIGLIVWRLLTRCPGCQSLREILPANSQVYSSGEIVRVLKQSLSILDNKIVDHGDRVAFIVHEMLKAGGRLKEYDLQKLYILCIFHDIGAEKVDEVADLLELETPEMMLHCAYGCAFLENLTPLEEYASTILYHHMWWENLVKTDCLYPDYANLIFIADRIDASLRRTGQPGINELEEGRGSKFKSEFVDLFLLADKDRAVSKGCLNGRYKDTEDSIIKELNLDRETILDYLKTLVFMIDFISPNTVTHTINTTSVSVELARRLGYKEMELEIISFAAFVHDIGKIAIPSSILEFPGKLSPEDMKIMKTHVSITDEILCGIVSDQVRNIAARHHEKLDGSGYPKGLTADKLTKPERILAVADIVSALIGTRSYKEPFPKEKVLSIISAMSEGGKLDPKICREVHRGYDDIMAAVEERQKPVIEKYESIYAQYQALMLEYGQKPETQE